MISAQHLLTVSLFNDRRKKSNFWMKNSGITKLSPKLVEFINNRLSRGLPLSTSQSYDKQELLFLVKIHLLLILSTFLFCCVVTNLDKHYQAEIIHSLFCLNWLMAKCEAWVIYLLVTNVCWLSCVTSSARLYACS